MGLRFTAFHTTALCSPTRAALLTGHNHHSVSTGVVVDQATGYPGYSSVILREAVAIGEILRQHGYDTSFYGKDHNVPQWEASQAGPFHNWAIGSVKGFDYFYGFVGDDTNQWQPNNLFRNTTPIEPYLGNPGWNLITAMADEAIGRIKMLNEVQSDRPFMIYYAPGGTHAPHHPTPEWVKKISDMHLFDKGWNALRDQIFANQKRLGVIPQNAKLTPWPDSLKTWDQLTDDAKKLFIRQADVYAAYLAYTDFEIGRVIQAIEDVGKLDNTLIIYISGDNGASPEGTLNRADDPRGLWASATEHRQRHRPEADRRRQHDLHLGQRERRRPAHDPVFRDVRLTWALPGRLDGLRAAVEASVGSLARPTARGRHARVPSLGAVQPRRRLDAGGRSRG
jgi:arylsulfatase